MWQAAFTLTLGFVLTVLIGGAYASYLQRRSWQHQNRSRLDEEERKQAGEICKALSELLDKRRYRTSRLLQSIEERARGEGSDDELRDRRSEYEKALADWNDQLTTRLVSVGVCFGHDVRDFLMDTIDQRFQDADEGVEKLYRQVAATPDTAEGIDTTDVAAMAQLLDALREDSYKLSSAMMLHIRQGEIGRTAPQQLLPSPAGQPSTSVQSGPPTPDWFWQKTQSTSMSSAAGNAASASTPLAPTRNFRQPAATARLPWHQGPSIVISALGLVWVICMSMPVWDWPGGDISGWELLTGPEAWPGKQWGWLPVLAMLAIAALAAATLADNWSRYRAHVQRSAIAVGAVSVVALVALGVQATHSYQSYCDGSAFGCHESLGIGYYLAIAAAALTAVSGLWGAIQSQRRP